MNLHRQYNVCCPTFQMKKTNVKMMNGRTYIYIASSFIADNKWKSKRSLWLFCVSLYMCMLLKISIFNDLLITHTDNVELVNFQNVIIILYSCNPCRSSYKVLMLSSTTCYLLTNFQLWWNMRLKCSVKW